MNSNENALGIENALTRTPENAAYRYTNKKIMAIHSTTQETIV